MIRVCYDNAGEIDYPNIAEAEEAILEWVVDEHDSVAEIYDTESGMPYSCVWTITLQEEGIPKEQK